jgi:phosphoglycerate dehydrogenase-like enzyme
VRICILDDVEGVALTSANWAGLAGVSELVALERHLDDPAELIAVLQRFDVVVLQRERTAFTRTVVEQLPRLRLVVTTGPRNAALDTAACTERGVTVCATRGGGTPVVELAWALLLAAWRDLPGRVASMQRGEWAPVAGRSLEGARLGLLGLGRTGTRMAAIATAFGMEVLAWSQNLTAETAAERGARLVGRHELFETSDVVSVHLLLSRRTRGLVAQAELGAMRPDAWLVNTSRGPIVDETALLTACREHWIAGAALDVFDVEPLPVDHELRRLPNVLLTPHVGYVTHENLRQWFADVVEDVAAYQAGSPIRVLTA